ncbi:protein Mo25-like [Anopheles cruzii]|uniref:protein Mo25-like n=1 Tax=Anopheles cruzii TaxID=68878 RepID=UPI0022EC2DCE|nr:protein Mo25-like [Anopheles cruzii]
MEKLKTQKHLYYSLEVIKNMILDAPFSEPYSESVFLLIEHEMHSTNLLLCLIQNFDKMDFQGKKCAVQIFNSMLLRSIGVPSETVKYICRNPEILLKLMTGYENKQNVHDYHSMLSECTRHQPLAKIMLHSEAFFNLFHYVEVLKDDVWFAPFSVLKLLLTGHKRLCAKFLEQNYDKVFTHYQLLLSSTNYMLRRESVALLSTLLADQHNVTIMKKYVSDPDKLKLIVNMVGEIRCVPYKVFDVLKLFVANRDKPRPILDILLNNRERLAKYVLNAPNDCPEDGQFMDDKFELFYTLQQLKSD